MAPRRDGSGRDALIILSKFSNKPTSSRHKFQSLHLNQLRHQGLAFITLGYRSDDPKVTKAATLWSGLLWYTISPVTLSLHRLSSTLARISSRVIDHYFEYRDGRADFVQMKS